MKFRYFFIGILIIAGFLQFNRVIDKGKYLSLKQTISFEKAPTKKNLFPLESSEKYLIFYNSKSITSKNIVDNVVEIFKFTKNDFAVVDITSTPDIKPYKYFIFATDNFLGFRKTIFEDIKKKIWDGGTLFLFSGVKDNPFNKISGIEKVKSNFGGLDTIKFKKKIFPGIDEWSPSKSSFVASALNVDLKEDIKIIAEIENKKPFIWENDYGKGRIICGNTYSFEDKIIRGILNQLISYGSDIYINPILNGKLIHLDDFPSPIPRFENKTIRKAYNMDTGDFYNRIWWQDMLGFAHRHSIIYSGFIIVDYNNIVDSEKMGDIPKITIQDLDKRGRELFIHGGELGIHGYNHNPLAFTGDINFEALNYVPWKNNLDVINGFKTLSSMVKDLFGEKVNLYTYVPPSNILTPRGKRMLAQAVPTLKTISSLFYGDSKTERGAFFSEIGRDREIPSLYNLPRFSSGFAYNPDDVWSTFNAVSIYGYMSHFVHPDDIISDDRSFGKDWEQILEEFEDMISETEKRYSHLEGITSSELTKRYMNIEDIKLFVKREGNCYKVAIKNFRNPFSAWVRLREEEIKTLSAGNFRLLKKYDNNNLYLIRFESPDTIIVLKDKGENI